MSHVLLHDPAFSWDESIRELSLVERQERAKTLTENKTSTLTERLRELVLEEENCFWQSVRFYNLNIFIGVNQTRGLDLFH